MSVEAINSANVNFGKSEKREAAAEKRGFGTKLTQPIKDDFQRAYGVDAKPNAKLVADYAADKVVKFGVFTIGTLLLFSKSKKITNGLTKAIRENFSNFGKKIEGGAEKIGLGKRIGNIVRQVKNNNTANVEGEQVLSEIKQEGGSILGWIKRTGKSIIKPKESFDAESGLGKLTEKLFKGKAKSVQEFFRKAGISNGEDLADTAAAVGATAIASTGLNNIADDVTKSDNEELANKSRRERVSNAMDAVEKLADLATIVGV